MNTTAVGRQAEELVAKYLQENGFQILDRNWRTRYCEIDIVARHAHTIYFIEVRYRLNTESGTGLESINQNKLRRMHRGARIWLAYHTCPSPAQLLVAVVTGRPARLNRITRVDP